MDGFSPGRTDHGLRLAALRAELARRNVDGFLVPRGDEHQGEYVAARSERLSWLTGFTGSAGLAVVLADRAALFTDGRYTLQAAAQVDADSYDLCHIVDSPATDWIAAHLPKGARLAYDPWLLTPAQLPRYRDACRRAGGDLVPAEGNLIDAVWAEQPSPPAGPVRIHPKKFAGTASADKRRIVAAALKAEGQEAQVLAAPDSIAWLLNVRGTDVPRTPLVLSFAILHADGKLDWFVDPARVGSSVARHLGKDVKVRRPDALGAALDRLAAKGAHVRIDPQGVPMWIAARLEHGGAKVARGRDLCLLPKARKNATEIAGTRAAHLRDGAAVTRFLAWLAATAPKGGLTEIAASDHLQALRAETGLLRDLSFDTISGSGPNGAVIHYKATTKTNRTIRPGDMYLVDSGAQYADGTTDITRTVAILGPDGKGPTKEMRDRFTRVLKGHVAIARARFPRGTAGGQLDILARRALWDAGLDYDHGTGHGVGSYLSVHEGPQRISKAGGDAVPLEPGMIISNEPGYYKPGAYGIRIENLVLVEDIAEPKGAERDLLAFETLTLAPIDRNLIETRLLDAGERAWLDAYHARVRKELSPLVDAKTRAWLKRATAPLEG